jgi:hypothetical protein
VPVLHEPPQWVGSVDVQALLQQIPLTQCWFVHASLAPPAGVPTAVAVHDLPLARRAWHLPVEVSQ